MPDHTREIEPTTFGIPAQCSAFTRSGQFECYVFRSRTSTVYQHEIKCNQFIIVLYAVSWYFVLGEK